MEGQSGEKSHLGKLTAGVDAAQHQAGMVVHSLELAERTKVLKMAQDDKDTQTNQK